MINNHASQVCCDVYPVQVANPARPWLQPHLQLYWTAHAPWWSCDSPISVYLRLSFSRQNPRQIYYICQVVGKQRRLSRVPVPGVVTHSLTNPCCYLETSTKCSTQRTSSLTPLMCTQSLYLKINLRHTYGQGKKFNSTLLLDSHVEKCKSIPIM